MGQKYPKVEAGEWVKTERVFHYKMACCDCGLVHNIYFRINKGVIEICGYRDNRATGQVRRHKEKTNGK